MTLTLSAAELVEFTHRDRPSAQARVLRAMGIPFKPHPVDGTLLVDRATARAWMGANVVAANDAPPTVNVEGIRSHARR